MNSTRRLPHTKLNTEQGNIRCQWQHCPQKFHTTQNLLNHLVHNHVVALTLANSEITCLWNGCLHQRPFSRKNSLIIHLKVHAPSTSNSKTPSPIFSNAKSMQRPGTSRKRLSIEELIDTEALPSSSGTHESPTRPAEEEITQVPKNIAQLDRMLREGCVFHATAAEITPQESVHSVFAFGNIAGEYRDNEFGRGNPGDLF